MNCFVISQFKKHKFILPVLWLYLFAVFTGEMFRVFNVTVPFILFIFILSFFVAFFLLYLFEIFVERIQIDTDTYSKRERLIISSSILSITLAVYIFYFICQYPGGASSDVLSQYYQALTGEYSDWHPVLHTLIFFTLPLNLTKFKFTAVVILQIVYFSCAFSYLMSVLIKNNIKKSVLLLFCVLVWFNPFLGVNLMYPWKDMALMIFAMILVAYYIQIVTSNGEWLKKKSNIVLFSLITVLCMYMRHNAILLAAPFLFLALFYIRKNKRILFAIIALVLVLVLAVQFLYIVIDVQRPDKRKLETAGMPATIWCNVMKEDPLALPEETRAVMYEIATPEQFENYSNSRSFNSVKWAGINTDIIDSMSYGEVIKYTLQCFVYAPRASLSAFANLTDQVWAISPNGYYTSSDVNENSYGIVDNSPEYLKNFFEQYIIFVERIDIVAIPLGSIGFQIIILLTVSLILLNKKRKSFIHIVPLLCYNFGTMLLLSGNDYRFFIFNIPVWSAILFLMFKDASEISI